MLSTYLRSDRRDVIHFLLLVLEEKKKIVDCCFCDTVVMDQHRGCASVGIDVLRRHRSRAPTGVGVSIEVSCVEIHSMLGWLWERICLMCLNVLKN